MSKKHLPNARGVRTVLVMVAFFHFLSYLVLAVMAVVIAGTVAGLRFARQVLRPPASVPLDPPTSDQKRWALENLETRIGCRDIAGVEALLLTRGHHLPTEVRLTAWKWLNERRAAPRP